MTQKAAVMAGILLASRRGVERAARIELMGSSTVSTKVGQAELSGRTLRGHTDLYYTSK